MAGELKIKRSSTPGAVPSSLLDGELAINTADKLLFYKDSGGVIRSKSLQAEGGSISDGDKGDIVVSSGVWSLEDVFKKSVELNIFQALGSAAKGLPLVSIAQATTNLSMTSQRLYLIPVWIPVAATITGVKWYQNTQGSYTSSNYNGVALYTYSAGTLTLVASSTDDGNIWKGASWQTKAFSATYSAAAGLYYVGALYSSSAQTAAPGFITSPLSNASVSVDFANFAKLSGAVGSKTSLPSTLSMSSDVGIGVSQYIHLFLY